MRVTTKAVSVVVVDSFRTGPGCRLCVGWHKDVDRVAISVPPVMPDHAGAR